ncbi:type II secretion system GspH family protein [Photobacterium sp. ZSDE20]|uniref:type II secretion system protein n=1 Tax=Vibrio pomeroyi TaxID=198832 RepID=UPI0023632C1C|nr:type II secretion system GspH family protein [Photobacterium sp. ZSDE20]
MKSKSQGFTLLELVVVIVILGILAVTAAPRFLGVQRDAHEALAQGAFAAFRNSIDMYHSQWLVDGEPGFDQVVNYGQGDIYPSSSGFPFAVGDAPVSAGVGLSGDDCVELWNALMTTDLTIRAHGSSVFPSEENIVGWYTADPSCYYYYTSGFSFGEDIPRLNYFPLTGEVTITADSPSS